ncbi:PAS domain S-box protein [Halosimplex litoreum]|uniref:PAS domain S-box protein n=1 Tax=Halosimplex litoreum TaxID=1198301 RepID=A0A7T3KUC6_9EURY|nr:bacterio-opsin activator domain-containing protein [Halosimplex litoreum]QPV62112.1 PAS domain S-box protein [Halosimplex litoreum]
MNGVILASIGLRVVGVGYSLVLLSRSDDRRFGFLTVMLALMATRQLLSARQTTTALAELPGLLVSVLALFTVHYLSSYVVEERRLTERLRGFRKAIEHAGHAIFLTDTDGTIEYANPAVESVVGHDPDAVVGENPRLWKSGEHDEAFYEEMWAEIASGNVWDGEIVNRRKSGDLCWVDMTIAPITDDTGAVERYVAVERDVTERKERRLRIEAQNERLERLNNTNEVLRDVNRELVAASTRREIERVLCDRFADSALFEGAWVGDSRLVDDGVDVRTAAGVAEATLEARLASGDGYRTVVDEVLERGSPSFVDDGGAPVDDPAAAAGVVVPLSYHDADYGVLVVESGADGAFESIDRGVFAELGLTVGDAINAAESRRTLAADDVTRLEFRVDEVTDPFVSLSAALECRVDLERLSEGDGDRAAYVSVTGSEPSAVAEHVDASSHVRAVESLCALEERCLLRLRTDDSSVVTTAARYGAAVRSLSIDRGDGRLVVDVSRSNDVRSVVEAVRSAHPGLELVSQLERERDGESTPEFRSGLEEALTERQLEAAQTAYFAGFFEWPRETSGEAVASMMGISQSTFTEHLRSAERKLFRELFEGRPDTVSGPATA